MISLRKETVMKKILIVNNNMHIGGVQKALVSLLCALEGKYEITLLLFFSEGAYCKEIPESVKVISANSDFCYLGMTKHDCKGHIFRKIKRSFYAAISRIFKRKAAISIMSWGQKKIRGYDVAISYLHNGSDTAFYGGCNEFVQRHVEAQTKIAFLHCDYEKCGANTADNAAQYAKFDRIAACSDGCKAAFLKALPSLRDKVITVKNCHDFSRIAALAATEPAVFSEDHVNLLTVARLGREKGVLRAIHALAKMGDLKAHIRYYIVGDGEQREALLSLIQEYGLSETVVYLGERTNPYGYMKAADLLLIPSYSEAAPLVIDEAASLGTPILTTETSSAKDMVEATGLGWVCENSVEGIASGLMQVLSDVDGLREKKNDLLTTTHDNSLAMEQFVRLLS